MSCELRFEDQLMSALAQVPDQSVEPLRGELIMVTSAAAEVTNLN